MELGQLYCRQLREQFTGLHANFPPNRPLALGDYGIMQRDVFQRMGNLCQLGVNFTAIDGTSESTYQFKSAGGVDVEFVAKGDIRPGGIPAVRAGLQLHFTKEDAIFFNAAGCTISQIRDVSSLGDAVIALLGEGKWESDFYVVTNLVSASSTTALISAGSGSEINLEAKSDVLQQIDLGEVDLSLRTKKTVAMALEIVTANSQTPLMQLSRVRGFFEKRLRPELAEMPTSPQSATIVLEAAPSGLDVNRAINAYIPILNASYALAQGGAVEFPPGYEKLGEIRASRAEAAELAEELAPDVKASVENDFRAMETTAAPLGQIGMESAAVPSPDAFGFLMRETATGALILSIRGTLTPIEWAADFVPVPVPFREVPGFGLVHLGFELLYRTVRGRIQQLLSNLDNGVRVTVVGHSLGAAMATLCAIDIKRNMNKPIVDLTTFGSPRVGKIDFRVHFNREIPHCYRVTNFGDIVPHVPSLLTLWSHVGEETGVRGHAAGSIPHSLAAYLDGLRKVGQPQELSPSGAGSAELAPATMLVSMRTP